jgi:hypothetical protein
VLVRPAMWAEVGVTGWGKRSQLPLSLGRQQPCLEAFIVGWHSLGWAPPCRNNAITAVTVLGKPLAGCMPQSVGCHAVHAAVGWHAKCLAACHVSRTSCLECYSLTSREPWLLDNLLDNWSQTVSIHQLHVVCKGQLGGGDDEQHVHGDAGAPAWVVQHARRCAPRNPPPADGAPVGKLGPTAINGNQLVQSMEC